MWSAANWAVGVILAGGCDANCPVTSAPSSVTLNPLQYCERMAMDTGKPKFTVEPAVGAVIFTRADNASTTGKMYAQRPDLSASA